ncbi:hypothetical protein EH165_15135 [Nakamurella antarctica]|uniref:Uncharacterized protein n=2 Tax=Nakamurella antarctica TaxID=1902245 RepID=A0A3G8ZPS0_9ACTN|nr:hypothetical protein EH165_15135 [Nakamurella antarctica]
MFSSAQATVAPSTATPPSTPPAAPDTTVMPPPSMVPAPGAVTGSGTPAARDFLTRLRAIAQTHSVLVLPYADADVVALTKAGMTGYVASAVSDGRAIAARVLGADAKLMMDVAWPAGGVVDTAALAQYQSQGYTSALLTSSAVQATSANQPTALTLTTAAGPINAAVSDVSLSGDVREVISGDVEGQAGRLNRLAANLVLRASTSQGIAAVFAPSRDYLPSGAGFSTLCALLNALSANGLVTGISLPEVAAQATSSAELTYPDTGAALELQPATLNNVKSVIAGFAGISDSLAVQISEADRAEFGPPAPAGLFDPFIAGLSRQFSAGLRGKPTISAQLLSATGQLVREVRDGAYIVKPAGSFTLTSETSPLFISLHNNLPFPVRLAVNINALDAARAGLSPQNIGIQTVAAGRSLTLTIPSEITRSGVFKVGVQLTGADSAKWGSPVVLVLRSTAIGSFTLILIVSAASVLFIGLVMRLRRRWRDRHSRAAQRARDAAITPAPNHPAPDTAAAPEVAGTEAATTEGAS